MHVPSIIICTFFFIFKVVLRSNDMLAELHSFNDYLLRTDPKAKGKVSHLTHSSQTFYSLREESTLAPWDRRLQGWVVRERVHVQFILKIKLARSVRVHVHNKNLVRLVQFTFIWEKKVWFAFTFIINYDLVQFSFQWKSSRT